MARVGAAVTTIVPIPVQTHVTLCAILQACRHDYRNLMKAEIKEQDFGWQNGMAKSITFIVTKDCQLACMYCYLVEMNIKKRMMWGVSLLLREPHLLRHLADDAEVYCVGILLIVDGEQGDAPVLLVDDGHGSDDACAASLATTFGGDGHAYLTYAGAKFSTLVGVFLEAVKEISIVIGYATMAFGKSLDRPVELTVPGYVVTHRLTPLLVGNCQTCPSQGTLSSPSGHGTLLRSRCDGGAWQPSLPRSLWASGCSCPDATAPPRARRCQPRRRTWSCSHGNRLSKLLSSSYEIDCRCKGSKFSLLRQLFSKLFCRSNFSSYFCNRNRGEIRFR